jgi:coproporphyrinogen III oxidase-like Fe-S oxidoreductase
MSDYYGFDPGKTDLKVGYPPCQKFCFLCHFITYKVDRASKYGNATLPGV